MIKRLFLAAMLTLCAAGAMAQGEKVLEGEYMDNGNNFYFYDLYSDQTAIIKDMSSKCDNSYTIPVSIIVGTKEYKVTEVAEKAFANVGITTGDKIEVTIYGTDIKLCADPFGSNLPADKGATADLHASPCLDVSIWDSYFTNVYKDQRPDVDYFFPCEIEYNSGGDYILQPFNINTDFYGETYTLNVTKSKITSIDIETQFVNPSDIAYDISVEKALLKNSAGKVCEELDYTGGPYDIADAVIVKKGEIREIKEKNVLVCTDLKFYPTPVTNLSSGELSIVSNVMSGSHPDRPSGKTLDEWYEMGDISNDYVALTNQVVVLADDFKRDTIALPCTAEFVIDGNQISLKITIAKDAEGVGSYGDAPYGKTHYQTNNYKPKLNLSQDAEFLFPLNGTYQIFVNKYKYKDPANNIDGPLEDISETSGSGLKEFTKTFFRVDGKAYWYGLFIDYSEANLTKTYNNSETMDVPDGKTPVMRKKRRFNPAFFGTGKVDNVLMTKLNYDENVEIEADYTLKFADPSVGTGKEITLTITPKDPFYKALLGDNNTVTLKGTIAPAQLSANDIAGIEAQIEESIKKTKFYDGSSEVGFSKPSQFDYTTEGGLKVTVTVTEAKYYSNSAEVSDAGSGYDIKASYKVDDNFYITTDQAGGYVRTKETTISGGAILLKCSPDNPEIRDILDELSLSEFEGFYIGASTRTWAKSVATPSADYTVSVTGVTTVDGDNNKTPVSVVRYNNKNEVIPWSMFLTYEIKDQNGDVCYNSASPGYSGIYVNYSRQTNQGFKIKPAEELPDDLKQKIQTAYTAQLGKTKEYDGTPDVSIPSATQLTVTHKVGDEETDLTFDIVSAQYNNADAATGKTITAKVKNPNFDGTLDVEITGAEITPIEIDPDRLSADVTSALGGETDKVYDGTNSVATTLDKITVSNASYPNDVTINLSGIIYYDPQNTSEDVTNVGTYPIAATLSLGTNHNYCFGSDANGYIYEKLCRYSTITGEITPAEITPTAAMFDGLFQTEKIYDGSTTVFDNAGKAINTNNPIDYKESGVTIFQITSAEYADKNAADQVDITLALSMVSQNYTLKSSTFTLKTGKIKPIEIIPTAAMFDGLFQTEKTYDGSTTVFDNAGKAINTNNPIDYKESGVTLFTITSAEYADKDAADEVNINLTLAPATVNYVLAATTFPLGNGKILPIQFDDNAKIEAAVSAALADIKNKPYDGTSSLVPNTLTVTMKKADTGFPDDVVINLFDLRYYDRTDGEFHYAADHGSHAIAMSLTMDENPNYCFFVHDGKQLRYDENWYKEKLFTGEITPKEIALDSATVAALIPLEKTYDGTADILLDGSAISEASKLYIDIVTVESDPEVTAQPHNLQIVAAKYSTADVTTPDLNPVSVTINNLSGNFVVTNLSEKGVYTVNGIINPKEIEVTFAPEDFEDIITLQRQYNASDPSAEILANEVTKNNNTFIIKSAEFKDNTVGLDKEIVVTIEPGNRNFTLKNTTYTLTGGTIWDYVSVSLNALEFAEGSAEVGKDITASATYNGSAVKGAFTYTPAAGTQLNKGTHTVKVEFAPQESYLRAPATVPSFEVKVNGLIVVDQNSIHQKDNHEAYCLDGVGNLQIEYSKVMGSIKTYRIEMEGLESLSQNGDVVDESVIYITLPADVQPGRYNGTIQFFGEDEESDKYPFSIDIYLPRDVVKQLYSDVLFADNHQSLYEAYQWFKNGKAISGANRQFYHEAGLDLSNKYTVEVKTKSGISLHSCPINGNATSKRALSDVKVYPNPAKAGIPFTLELVGGDNDFSDTEIQIYNNSGTLVQRVTNVDKTITLTLPRGNYSGALIRHGEKSSFKIIVE
ncbi:MAG: hypothetical protein IKS00_01235 [Bacteroidales bacterium]|nr:hypothetical protein [Bacteroidales bacterium]